MITLLPPYRLLHHDLKWKLVPYGGWYGVRYQCWLSRLRPHVFLSSRRRLYILPSGGQDPRIFAVSSISWWSRQERSKKTNSIREFGHFRNLASSATCEDNEWASYRLFISSFSFNSKCPFLLVWIPTSKENSSSSPDILNGNGSVLTLIGIVRRKFYNVIFCSPLSEPFCQIIFGKPFLVFWTECSFKWKMGWQDLTSYIQNNELGGNLQYSREVCTVTAGC